jgi:putative ABC transport system ATP-binding protein
MSMLVESEDLTLTRGAFSLRLPSWQVSAGQRVALHGPSGCGKSTLLSLVSGQLLPTSGRLVVDDQDLSALTLAQRRDWRARRIGFIFQDFPLIEHLSASENVLLPYRISRALPLTPAVRQRAAELLDALGLSRHRRTHPARLSQGERQRVAIARALVTQPGLLLADEPTAGLDPTQSAAVLDLLWQLSEARGLTLLMVTHDPALLARFDHRLDVSTCSEGR